LNYGTNISFWITTIQIIVVALLFVKTGFTTFNYIKKGLEDKTKWKKYGHLLFWTTLTVVFIYIMLIGYGKGSIKLQSEEEPIGRTQILLETPDENVDSIREVTEKKRPHTLKRQDESGFEEEEKEADDYLKKHELN